MNFIVSLILKFMTKENVITDDTETQDFYRYGVEITISSILNIVLIIFLGAITTHLVESVIFLIVFIFLRSFMGGYHADTYFRCNLLMCVSFLIVTYLYESLKYYMTVNLSIIMAMPIFIIVWIFCPVENKNKPITNERKRKLKIVSIVMSLAFAGFSIMLIINKIFIGVMVLFIMLLIALLIIAAKIKERRRTNK